MTTAEWLASRTPRPPAALAEAVGAALGAAADSKANDHSTRLVAAVGVILPRILASDCRARSGALDLLALDALLTYAMEASIGDAKKCERASADALGAIASATRTLRVKADADSRGAK